MMSAFNRNPMTDLQPADLGSPGSSEAPRRNPMLVVWQRRWIIVICLVLALGAAIVYLSVATPIYQGTAQVIVEQNTPRIIANDPSGMMMANAPNYLWTQCTLLRSRAILEPVANDPAIRGLKTFEGDAQDVFGQLRNMTTAAVGRRDDVISVSVKSPFAEDAARIANAIVVAFTRYHDTAKRSTAREILDILQNQKVKLDSELAAKRQAMLEFKTKNASFSLGTDRANPTMERLARLSAALTEMQLNTLNAQAAYETAKTMMDDPIKARQLLETRQFKSETAQLRREMREMQQRFAGLSKNYMPGFPELNAIQASIKQLNDEMAAEDRKIIEAYVAELDAQVQAAKRNEEQIQNLLNEQRKEVLQLNTVAAQYAVVQSELEGLERAADEIYGRIKQLSVTEDVGALNVQRVESAVPADHPVEPNKPMTLLYALVAGSMLGAGLAFLRDWMDQRLRSAEEIKQVLALPVLGVVPHISGTRTPMQRGMHLHLEPMSDVAEAYRTIRTAVYFGQTGGVAKTLLITSPAPGDGKTTLASNLAIAMAQAGNRILLLDADFRKPTQHKIFELDKRSGLSSVLAGDAKLAEVIHSTPIAGLDVLPCGPIPANPSEILNSQTFADLLQDLSSRYDHVLLDSPPIMPVTDARILAASCDATVLALRAEKTTRKGAVYARDVLHSVGSAILGVVVNDVPRRRGIYGYYYSDAEMYQYGYGHRRTSVTSVPSGKEKGNGATALPAPVASKTQA